MELTEIILFWMTVFIYVVAFCLTIFGFVTREERHVRYAVRILWAGLFFHTATGIVRWLAGGHAPVTDTYELNLTGAWFTVLIFVIFERFRKVNLYVALVVIPASFLVLGHGVIFRSAAIPMGPAYQSPWLVVHVIFAWIAFGCFVIATGAALLLLIRERWPSWKPLERVPASGDLDLASYRFIILGIINHAVMLVSGAIWAKNLWGHYWSWDALETWSLITFLLYAFYLHARSFLKWKMRRAAWIAMVCMLVVVISFWGVGWFTASVKEGHEWSQGGLRPNIEQNK